MTESSRHRTAFTITPNALDSRCIRSLFPPSFYCLKHCAIFTLSNAKPKIADYAFTTVVPNLGVCDIDGKIDDMGKSLVLVDIPGLLEGAHDGVGLGLSFLRHVQRCR